MNTTDPLLRALGAGVDSRGRSMRGGALRRRFRRLSFRAKLVVISTTVSLICLLLGGIVLAASEALAFRQDILSRAIALADVTAANSEAAVSFEDPDSAARLLANLRAADNVEAARILVPDDGGLVEFARFSRHGGALRGEPQHAVPAAGYRFVDRGLEVTRPILQGGVAIGHVQLRVDLEALHAMLRRLALTMLALMGLTVVVAWLISFRLQRVITRPVTELVDTAQTISRERDFSRRASVLAEDELGTLTRAFNEMLDEVQAHDAARERVEAQIRQLNEDLEAKVRVRTQELVSRNQELRSAIDRLRAAQSQLVESEKMAALGGLVAGVAHEINTPIGMCVTMVSHVGEQVAQLKKAYASGIRRSDLEHFIEHGEQSIEIVQANLARAAELVRSFKRVAVDQSSEARRRFRVAEYLDQVLLSLRPQIKRSAVAIDIRCDPALEIDSYPGVLAQIVTNFTVNALTHAFPDNRSGHVVIDCSVQDGEFVLDFSDDGVGMGEEVRPHVFEPFFTTRRGEGGSGLGLHIVYNQVTQTLGGSIRCESAPGRGSRFVVRFPVQASVAAPTA